MPIRKAEAEWKGNLIEGAGRLKVGSGAFDGPYSFRSRLEDNARDRERFSNFVQFDVSDGVDPFRRDSLL